ncbi:MAG TPA: hypothetical protein VIH82_07680 [Acidimicrobiia bacterium]|jgi:hypothetical protein
MKRAAVVAVVLLVVVTGFGSAAHGKPQKPPKELVERMFPRRVFGPVKNVICITDPKGDWGFFNGQPAGLHDPYVDIRRACSAYFKRTPRQLAHLDTALACGANAGGLVVCSSSNPPVGLTKTDIALFSMELAGTPPHDFPAGETARFQLFLDVGGDPATKFQASPESPDSSSVGTNMTYQAVFNDPGTSVQDLQLLAVDRRTPQQFLTDSTARIWLRRNLVTFVVPEGETGPVSGARGGAFHGSRTAAGGGDAGQNNQDVTGGGVHAPYKLLPWIE